MVDHTFYTTEIVKFIPFLVAIDSIFIRTIFFCNAMYIYVQSAEVVD